MQISECEVISLQETLCFKKKKTLQSEPEEDHPVECLLKAWGKKQFRLNGGEKRDLRSAGSCAGLYFQ
jgi:hypothetical protein